MKSTVVLDILDADGNAEEITYYGSSCAAKVLGVTGRGAGAKVLGKARAAHRALVLAAYDGRTMLAGYGLPEVGEPTTEQMRNAVLTYWNRHCNAMWAAGVTNEEWRTRTVSMLHRYQAVIASATRLGVTIPTTDRERDHFINTWH